MQNFKNVIIFGTKRAEGSSVACLRRRYPQWRLQQHSTTVCTEFTLFRTNPLEWTFCERKNQPFGSV